MKMFSCNFFVFFLLPISAKCDRVNSVGILDGIINATLEALRPSLENVYVSYQTFETGPQEIGMLKGNFSDMKVEGLDKFSVKTIKTTLIDINNLTIVDENILAKGLYFINGTLAFPLGKTDIHLFGNGEFSAEMKNLSVSMKVKIRSENGQKVVKDFDLIIGLEKLKIYMKNLMGGGDLEKVFNQLLNDVGLVVFNYYKEPMLDIVKPQIRQFITEMLNAE